MPGGDGNDAEACRLAEETNIDAPYGDVAPGLIRSACVLFGWELIVE